MFLDNVRHSLRVLARWFLRGLARATAGAMIFTVVMSFLFLVSSLLVLLGGNETFLGLTLGGLGVGFILVTVSNIVNDSHKVLALLLRLIAMSGLILFLVLGLLRL